MTKNTTPANTVPDLVAGLAAGTVTIEAIDPQIAQLDPNIRTNPDVPDWFIDSIRAEGVREPVLARRSEDGTVFVYDGQRRLLAARQAGTTSMLAVFGIADGTGTQAGRIMDQLRTFARTDLALGDRLTAYEQLTLDGISIDKIAKSAGTSTEDVTASLNISKSDSAKKAVSDGTESFDRLILIAEFDGDDDAIDRITFADDDELSFTAQEIRDDRKIEARLAEILAEYESEGITATADTRTSTPLNSLTDSDSNDRTPLDEDAHKECPGHTIIVSLYGLADDDLRIRLACSQPELHRPRWGGHQTATASVEVSQEEASAMAETKREERRRLIANNKAWDTATAVRGEWLTAFLARKKLPADAAAFVAVTLTRHAYDVSGTHVGTAATLLGVEDYSGRDALASVVETTPTKAGHVNLAIALAARENSTSRESWRNPNNTAKTYLLQLEKWNYHLSPVERIAAGYPETIEEPKEVSIDTISEDETSPEADAE